MNISLEVSHKSLCKHGEELCGDKLEIIKTENSDDGSGKTVCEDMKQTGIPVRFDRDFLSCLQKYFQAGELIV